ncbi:MAG: hypothetical protein OQJ80_10865 [Kangiella sp.]|nr:hypothetical protein [Kangiella sp.]
MNRQTLFNGLQLLLLIFICYKVLELDKRTSKLQQTTTPGTQATPISKADQLSTDHNPYSLSLTSDQVRTVIAEELDKALANHPANSQIMPADQNQNTRSTNPDAVAEVNNQIVNYMSDGTLTESELATIERSMAQMNELERKKIIQLLAKNATDFSVIITH